MSSVAITTSPDAAISTENACKCGREWYGSRNLRNLTTHSPAGKALDVSITSAGLGSGETRIPRRAEDSNLATVKTRSG